MYRRNYVRAVMMTAADLCASTKPWQCQYKTVQVIFEEFYSQVFQLRENLSIRKTASYPKL